jgi:hypothetical protein
VDESGRTLRVIPWTDLSPPHSRRTLTPPATLLIGIPKKINVKKAGVKTN